MKRVLLLLTLLLTLGGSVCAQKIYYQCTGDRVRVRTAPSMNAKQLRYNNVDHAEPGPVYMNKGEVVVSTGVKKNGFVKVTYAGRYNLWNTGWASEKFLRKMQKCTHCAGKGYFDQVCPECGGEGDEFCCDFTGKKQCPKCYGLGYK